MQYITIIIFISIIKVFRPGQLDKNWSEVRSKVEAVVNSWLPRKLSLKSRAVACATYIFPLILYQLAVLPLPA